VRNLVASPKVATYDLQPEMSARGVTDVLVEAIASGSYDFTLCNYANADMVDTGSFLRCSGARDGGRSASHR
jgi:2,3-bisphosphoglycerate-independent phosphoglycerate mutase